MGRVYLGRTRGGRAVAVKVVRPELAGDEQFRLRFAREVAAARKVNGAFTAGVVDADPDGSPAWLATVFVAGVSLDQAVAAHGSWPPASVLALGAGLAEALEAIHEVGVVHRDLKPSNVLLASDGPRVIDFGISVVSEATVLTQSGMVVGTPGFMSPEQVKGLAVGPASDVFSLGAVLAFTATGVGPFGTGAVHSLNFRAVHEEPRLEGLPPEIRALVERCLAKDPDRRPSVPALLESLIESVGGGQPASLLLTQSDWLPAPVARTVLAGGSPSHAEPTAEARWSPQQPLRPVLVPGPTAPPAWTAETDSRATSAPSRHWLRAAVVLCVLALPIAVVIWVMASGTSTGRNATAGSSVSPASSVSPVSIVSTGEKNSSSSRPSPSGATSTSSAEVSVTTVEAGPIRRDLSRDSQQVGTLGAGRNRILCRAQGEPVHDNGVYNSWWLWTESNAGAAKGWVSAYYISGTDQAKADDGTDIPDCGTLTPSGPITR
jgi:serine/threonine protein kinase